MMVCSKLLRDRIKFEFTDSQKNRRKENFELTVIVRLPESSPAKSRSVSFETSRDRVRRTVLKDASVRDINALAFICNDCISCGRKLTADNNGRDIKLTNDSAT